MILTIPHISRSEAFERGRDCGRNGPNEHNCHFAIFSCPENTKAWEYGKKAGENESPQEPSR